MYTDLKLEEAGEYIYSYLKMARVPVIQCKVKHGTLRMYCSLGWRNLLDATHPGYMHYSPYPKWLMTFDILYAPMVFKYSGLSFLSYHLHKRVYIYAYKKALKKYPHLRRELTCCMDYPELL